MPVSFTPKNSYGLEDLREIVSILRSEEGCPWDREQTHESIRSDFIEEVYEAVDAIDCKDADLLKEELGDVLLQVVFHASIEEEKNRFGMDDVITGVCEKMIQRHPHVFSDQKVSGTEEVLENWEEIKSRFKGTKSAAETLHRVPACYPALMRGQKLIKRAEKAGVAFSEEFFLSRAKESLSRLSEGDRDAFSALLLFLCGYAHKAGISAELLLGEENKRFISAFEKGEQEMLKSGEELSRLACDELFE